MCCCATQRKKKVPACCSVYVNEAALNLAQTFTLPLFISLVMQKEIFIICIVGDNLASSFSRHEGCVRVAIKGYALVSSQARRFIAAAIANPINNKLIPQFCDQSQNPKFRQTWNSVSETLIGMVAGLRLCMSSIQTLTAPQSPIPQLSTSPPLTSRSLTMAHLQTNLIAQNYLKILEMSTCYVSGLCLPPLPHPAYTTQGSSDAHTVTHRGSPDRLLNVVPEAQVHPLVRLNHDLST